MFIVLHVLFVEHHCLLLRSLYGGFWATLTVLHTGRVCSPRLDTFRAYALVSSLTVVTIILRLVRTVPKIPSP